MSKALGRDVKLTRADLEKPSYEEYWPNIEGLEQREKVTDETMPPRTFFDIAVIHILTTSTIIIFENYIQKGALKLDALGQT